MTGRLKPLNDAKNNTSFELNPNPKLIIGRNENQELLFLDELT